ncbi:MAG: hypothetical protein AB8B92_09530 [Gammaproteobacteria bacterium]
MYLLQRLTRLVVISSCLFTAGVSCTKIDGEKNSPPNPTANLTAQSTIQSPMMNPMMMGQMNGMINPHMYLNMMGQMSGMMNPMMMNGKTTNPMSMNMVYPMMGMMGQMMPGMGTHYGSPMTQMPSGQMMTPKQYEQWFNQMTENMKNMTQQTPVTN